MWAGISEQEKWERNKVQNTRVLRVGKKSLSLGWGPRRCQMLPTPSPPTPPQQGRNSVSNYINYTWGTHSVILMQHQRWPKHFSILISIICLSSSSLSACAMPSSLTLSQDALKKWQYQFSLCFELLNHKFRRTEFSCCVLKPIHLFLQNIRID